MAELQQRAHVNMLRNQLLNAILHPTATDPASPVEYQIWANSTTERMMMRVNGVNKPLAFLDDVTAGSLTGALWNAQSVVIATADDTPEALIIPEGSVLGRSVGGNVTALDAAALKTMLSIPAGAQATEDYVNTQIAAKFANMDAEYDTLQKITNELLADDTVQASLLTQIASKTGKYSVDIGDASSASIDIVHNLGSNDVVVNFRLNVDDQACLVAWKPISANAITCEFNLAPSAAEIRATVVG